MMHVLVTYLKLDSRTEWLFTKLHCSINKNTAQST